MPPSVALGRFCLDRFRLPRRADPYSWPSVNSQFGIVDTCGFPKDNYFYYKAWWARNRCCIFFPIGTGRAKRGRDFVWVHSNLESVELFVHGQSSLQKVERSITWSGRSSTSLATSKRAAQRFQSCTRRKQETTGPQRRSASRPIARSSPPMEKIWRWYAWNVDAKGVSFPPQIHDPL